MDMEICRWCTGLFDSENEGHYDGDAGLGFCNQICEEAYERSIGLPDDYKLPKN